MFENISVNGIPLEQIVDQADRKEKLDFRAQELQVMGRTIRAHSSSNTFRNHSGAKSGKGRVIYSAAAGGWQ